MARYNNRSVRVGIFNVAGTEIEYDTADEDRTWGVDAGSIEIEAYLMTEGLKFGEVNVSTLGLTAYGLNVNDLIGRRIQANIIGDEISYDTLKNSDDDDVVNSDGDDIATSGSEQRLVSMFDGYIAKCVKDEVGGDVIITAYDKLYFIKDNNVADWWNTYISTHATVNLKSFILSLVGTQSITSTETSDIPSQINFTQLYSVYADSITNISFGDLLSMACEIACVTPIMLEGKLRFRRASTSELTAIDASDNIETLETKFEEYETAQIDGVAFYGSTSELLYATSNATNAYKVVGNLFLNASTTAELTAIADGMYARVSNISYTPGHIKFIEGPPNALWKISSPITVNGKICFISHVRMYGSQLIETEVDCKAKGEYLSEEIDNPYGELVSNQKISKISRDLGELSLTVREDYVTKVDYEAEVQNLQDQIDGHIDYWDGDNTVPTLNNAPAVDWTTEQLKNLHLGDLYRNHYTAGTSEVTDYYRFDKDTTVTPNVFSWVLLGAGDIDEALRLADEANQKADQAQADLDLLEGRVGSVEASVTLHSTEVVMKVETSTGRLVLCKLTDDPATQQTTFRVQANNLDLSASDVFNIMSGGTLNLTGRNISITSDYFSVTPTGVLTCTNANIASTSSYFTTKVNSGSLSFEYNGTEVGRVRGSAWDGGLTHLGTTFLAGQNAEYLGLGYLVSDTTSETRFIINNGLNLNGNTETLQLLGSTFIEGPLHMYDNQQIRWVCASTDWAFITAEGTSNAGYLELASGDDGNEPIFVSQNTGHWNNRTRIRRAYLLDGNGDTSFPGNLTVGGFANAKLSEGGMPITTTATDTVANWGAQGVRSYFYGPDGALNGKPTNYGHLLTLGHGSEVGQLWLEAPSGVVYKRGGNASGFSSWTYLLDSTMLSTYSNHNNAVAYINNNIMEIGTHLDFHFANSSNDYDGRFNISSTGGNHFVSSLSITQGSSRKAKKNIEDISQEEADKILELEPKKFDYIRANTDNQAERGFIAEEVMDILPNLVAETDDEEMPYSLNYNAIIPYLVKVVQRQQEEINKLKGE